MANGKWQMAKTHKRMILHCLALAIPRFELKACPTSLWRIVPEEMSFFAICHLPFAILPAGAKHRSSTNNKERITTYGQISAL
jgi:hypothetical protein